MPLRHIEDRMAGRGARSVSVDMQMMLAGDGNDRRCCQATKSLLDRVSGLSFPGANDAHPLRRIWPDPGEGILC
jgi:hypothetical protein